MKTTPAAQHHSTTYRISWQNLIDILNSHFSNFLCSPCKFDNWGSAREDLFADGGGGEKLQSSKFSTFLPHVRQSFYHKNGQSCKMIGRSNSEREKEPRTVSTLSISLHRIPHGCSGSGSWDQAFLGAGKLFLIRMTSAGKLAVVTAAEPGIPDTNKDQTWNSQASSR